MRDSVAARIGETAGVDKWIGGPDEAILRCMNERAAGQKKKQRRRNDGIEMNVMPSAGGPPRFAEAPAAKYGRKETKEECDRRS